MKKGIPSHYAPTLYAPSMYAQPAYGGGMSQPAMPMLPLPNGGGGPPPMNGYGREYDGASSGECINLVCRALTIVTFYAMLNLNK